MGFVDAIFILDQTQFPILHHKLKPEVPSFDYVRSQLLIAKRELLSKCGVDISTEFSTNEIFDSSPSMLNLSTAGSTLHGTTSDYVTLDPVFKLDSDWLVSWCKIDGLYFLTLGTAPQEFLEVVSDDEADEAEDHEEAEEDDGEDYALTKNDGSTADGSNMHSRGEYSPLSEEEEEEEENEVSENDNEINSSENGHLEEDEQTSLRSHESAAPRASTGLPAPSLIANSPNPLQYISFLDVFSQAIKLMLQTVTLSSHKVQLNAHRIIMLLQELLDASVPFIIDMNQLRELLPNGSVIDKIVSATKQIQNTAASSISNIKSGSISNLRNDLSIQAPANGSGFVYSTILERSGNKTPWRKANVKTAQNEIFVDIYETIDLIISPKKNKNYRKYSTYSTNNYNPSYDSSEVSFTRASIHGHMDLTTSLVGDPTTEVQLGVPFTSYSNNISLDDCYPSLHRGINRQVWKNSNSKVIQLVPPQEKSKLLTYNIDLMELHAISKGGLDLNKFCGLINVELHSGLGANANEFEVVVHTGCGLNTGFGISSSNGKTSSQSNIKDVQDLVIELFLPTSTSLDMGGDGERKEGMARNISASNNGSTSNALINRQIAGSTGYGANQSHDQDGNGRPYDLKVLRSSTGTVTRTIHGSYEWKLDSDVVVGGVFTLRGCIDADAKSGEENSESDGTSAASTATRKKVSGARGHVSPRFLRVHYKHHGSVPSGIKVQGIKVISGGAKAKPFKGVKYTTAAGDFIVR